MRAPCCRPVVGLAGLDVGLGLGERLRPDVTGLAGWRPLRLLGSATGICRIMGTSMSPFFFFFDFFSFALLAAFEILVLVLGVSGSSVPLAEDVKNSGST